MIEKILLIAIFIMASMLLYDFFFGKNDSPVFDYSILNLSKNLPQELPKQKVGAKKIGEMCAADDDCLNGKCINSLCGIDEEEKEVGKEKEEEKIVL
jgi:hypothetical protein